MLKILLVDDHAIVREGFKRLFADAGGFEVVAESGDAASALEAVHRLAPDIAVLDLSLGRGASGLALLSQIKEQAPGTQCVMMSMHDDPGLVLRALEFGARGYVSKAVAPDELVGLLRRVAEGEVVLSSDLTPTHSATSRPVGLTARERDTLRGLLSDLPPKAIAMDLDISVKTLYRHRANLMEKLGARTQGDLVRIARERGLLLEG
ncbi:response regulator transcription factor [Lysobacter soyae]|jgi:two-component system uhpT operon response regulator UhpA|uniref:Response regulator transcription factor n=1 Tax=Lysobacter soyae TaxID=2764185 RepID=A0ABX8WP00_9GAMM|nr:response regulator transcription factor [Lysobacter sp. CJ11]QYR52466.1 response regulator transcription factor [Lysobacter sp. CJ11]